MTTFNILHIFSFCAFFFLSCQSKAVRDRHSDVETTSITLKEKTPITKSIFKNSTDDSIVATKVNLYELKENLDKFHDKYIETEGIFCYGFETLAISSRESLDNSIVAFWLQFSPIPSLQDQAKRISNHRIRIRGKLDKLDTGHLNGYTATISEIYYLEVL